MAVDTLGQPFECVLLDSPGLAARADPNAFAEHFRRAPSTGVVEFPNLGGDAILVVTPARRLLDLFRRPRAPLQQVVEVTLPHG